MHAAALRTIGEGREQSRGRGQPEHPSHPPDPLQQHRRGERRRAGEAHAAAGEDDRDAVHASADERALGGARGGEERRRQKEA